MEKYRQNQSINPAVTSLRFNDEEIKEIILKHLENIGYSLPEIANSSFWYEEERLIPGVNIPPHNGFVLRIEEKNT